MQAVAAEFSGYAGKPPLLFELRRVRKTGKGRAIAATADSAAFWRQRFKDSLFRFTYIKTGS
jgi:hypothetical protein